MAKFVKIAQTTQVQAGSMKTVFVSGKTIMLVNIGGIYSAIDNACTHHGCSLSGEGFLEGNIVTCGCHGAQFDVTTGKVLALPATVGLTVYPLEVRGNDIYVRI